jgi:predicted nucleic acid-binding protein
MRYLIVLMTFLALLTSCEKEVPSADNTLIQHIPENSKIILHTDDLQEIATFIEQAELYKNLSELSRVQEIKKTASFLKNYELDDNSFITLSIEGKNEVVITLISEELTRIKDSSSTRKKMVYDGKALFSDVMEGRTYFYTEYNDIHIASSSRLVVESLMRREIANYIFNSDFNDIFNRTQNSDFGLYIKGSNDEWLKQFLLGNNVDDRKKDALWYQVEPQTGEKSLKFDGIVTYKDSVKMYQSLFNNVIPQPNKLMSIAPVTSTEFISVTYADTETLLKNLDNYHSSQLKLPLFHKNLLANTSEFAEMTIDGKTALAFFLKPYETLFIDLDSMSVADYTFRDKKINTLSQTLQTKTLKPLFHSRTYSHAAQLEEILVFAENQKTLETIISNIQNNTVIGKQYWWTEAITSLSDESTLLKITNLSSIKEVAASAIPEDEKLIKSIKVDDHPVLISQYVHENEYAHYHFIAPTATGANGQSLTSQVASYRSETAIIAGPFLFPNHITKKHDILFQDEDLQLHMISSKGILLWSKPLDAEINGTINVVDGYKNGRKQLVFSTAEKVYYLDRKGKDVNSYPRTFREGITQPVSVFDYDKSRNYRFLVTTGSKLTMLNIDGKVVTGFKYAKDEIITTQPQHYRSGTKDYISFTMEDQSIAILNRTGRVRTSLNRKLEATSALYFDENNILLHHKDNKKAIIDLTTGAVELVSEPLTGTSIYKMQHGLEIIQNNNVLIINDKELTLPYGSYTAAEITLIDGSPYVHLVDKGESKVYIIDQNVSIVPGLPVYGKEVSQLEHSDIRYLITKDERDIIIYKW